jgi:WD40 repeat protein
MGAGFISNDRKVACPSMDGKILEWDALSGRVTREIKCRGPVEVVLLSPDGSRCLAACGEGVSLIDLDTGKELGRYDRFVPESEAAFAPDSKTFLILKDTAQIYDAGTGALVRKLEYKKS